MNDFDQALLDSLTDEWQMTGAVASRMGITDVPGRLKVARHLRSLATFDMCEATQIVMGTRNFDAYRRIHAVAETQ